MSEIRMSKDSNQQQLTINQVLQAVSRLAITWSGTSAAFIIALATIIVWLITGPFFNYSDTWQLVINTGTTVITFLMVFLIQRAQNKDSIAIHLKLNELIAAVKGASNHLIESQNLSEDELKTLEKHYAKLVELWRNEVDLCSSHSVEEAEERHSAKQASS